MEFKRDIYRRLLEWKKDNTGKVLEISGARQVGKTYILKKFANENFTDVIYINMAEISGARFLRCMDQAENWTPGMPMPENTVRDAVRLYYSEFQDNKDTVILIDEIQESSQVYNLIRTFSREFSCRVIVTGSYLGRLLAKEFFLPAGDLDTMVLEPLTFAEFTGIFGKRELYEAIDLFGASDESRYQELRDCFELYQRIGGYPSVVDTYLQYKDFERCDRELMRLMDTFINESKRYFDDVLETNTFEKLFHGIAVTLIREKQGIRDLTEDLSKIVYKQESGRFTKKMLNHAIGWLHASHIIGYAGKSIDCDYLNIKENARFYFLDLGIAHLFLARAGADKSDMKGIIAENFVYLILRRHIPEDIAGNSPWFASYEKTKGELDFYARSIKDYKNYGIEVKSGDAQAKTARALFDARRLDYVYYLKGGSSGGMAEDGRLLTVPLCLAERIRFDLGVNA